jgi:tRNA modification GTPase
MPGHPDTIVALATPAGTAAIAVVRASGPACAALAREIFGYSAPPPLRVAQHADYRDRAGALVDDVLATFFQAPNSYTGEDSLEISCHGNPFIAQKILADLLARGCRSAEPGEFTKRAFLHGRLALDQAEAVMDLIHARSERALAAAQQQLRGALGRRMAALTDALLGALARIEAYIDFPEDDLPAEDRSVLRGALEKIAADTARLLATQRYGALLRDGIKTVIIGEPNAGKSSLLNRLAGHERALVSPEPGTTRDFIEERVPAGPHWLRLTDTAGLNPAPGPIERLGIAKTHERAAEADLLLLVLDATRPAPSLPPDIAAALRPENTIVVLNKCDLLAQAGSSCRSGFTPDVSGINPDLQSAKDHLTLPPDIQTIAVSALTGAGVDNLLAEIVRRADALRADTGEDLVAINARHAHALDRAQSALRDALAKLADAAPAELLASDLRECLAAYGDIAGKVDNEQMLDRLFATFCIGK